MANKAEVDADLRNIAIFIGAEITQEIIRNRGKNKPTLSQIKRLFADLIGMENFETFERCLTARFRDQRPNVIWKEFVKSIPAINFKKGKFSCRLLKPPFLGELSNGLYKEKMFSEMLKLLLEGDLKNVNFVGSNGNTVLHILSSLPMETREAYKSQIELMQLLVDKSPDCSIKNDQGMTALHIIAGNYLLDPENALALSKQRGLNPGMYTTDREGKLEKLSCMENIISKPFQARGPYGNSILHDWVIYQSIEVQDEVNMDIGEWIMEHAGVPLNVVNDHGCTPLHYAVRNEHFEFLCSKGAGLRKRKNDQGESPLMYLVKHCHLRDLVCTTASKIGAEPEDLLAKKFDISSSPDTPCLSKYITKSDLEQRFSTSLDKQEFFERDNSDRDCVDYLLLFVTEVLLSVTEEAVYEDVKYVIQNWIMKLAVMKDEHGTFIDENAKQKTLHKLVSAFFECKSHDLRQDLLDCVERLLYAGADPNKTSCGADKSLFRFCCEKATASEQHENLLKMLCEYGCDQAEKDQHGETPTAILLRRGLGNVADTLKSIKPKQRIQIIIQSTQYKNELDKLSRETTPRRIEDCRYYPNEIGKGSMGSVHLAIDEGCKREVALKKILKNSFRKGITREIQALKKLEQSPNVVNFYFLRQDEDFYYIALELMDGDLESLVTNRAQDLRTQGTTYNLSKDVSRGLEFLHQEGIVHRDLKPGNILYREKPEFCLKLADFDLAKHLNVSSTCQTSMGGTSATSLCGTRGWMAPELISKKQKEPSKESDMFAFGLVLHFLFSRGFHPFHSCSTSLLEDVRKDTLQPHEIEGKICKKNAEIHPDLNPEQTDLVDVLLNKDPHKRPPSKELTKLHCYFWSDLKKVYFICKVGDQPEVAKPRRTPHSTFENQLENSSFGLNLTNWNVPISHLYQEVASKRTYNTSSVLHLIRFFRNAYAHFEERSPQRRAELLRDHILKEFPEFFLTVCKEVYNQGWHRAGSNKEWIRRMLEEMD